MPLLNSKACCARDVLWGAAVEVASRGDTTEYCRALLVVVVTDDDGLQARTKDDNNDAIINNNSNAMIICRERLNNIMVHLIEGDGISL